ncbi:response regulator transcription factor [Mesorhizobium sp. M00.F.Ca.ET.186.01.1.1]|nr:response regulator transcription factor [Mesorhizobium sp. M00.F.Ca.ET.186.01.1.1]
MTILVADDDAHIRELLRFYLEKEGYCVLAAADGSQASVLLEQEKVQLAIVDVMMPGKNGWELCKEIREYYDIPVIMLTALGHIDNKLAGLEQGADDYITKPFIADEVVARVKAVLRRSKQIIEGDQVKQFGSLKVDFKAYTVTLHGIELAFTPKDMSLFLFLAQYKNQTFTREQLIEQVWGMDYEGSDRAVDLAIKRIRRSLENWPASEGEIRTYRGLGYKLCVYE